jgi:outer membrane protein assembly factor BamB
MQGVAYDNLYYISTVPGNAGVFYAGGAEGVIFALDQANGTIVWSAKTLETTDYWGNASVNSGGGCWFPPAVDTQTGTIFFGIANPAPFPGQVKGPGVTMDYPNGISRPGDNLYTDSMMAFDHKTGAMKWYTQVWPHDISDYDLQQAPVLATATVNGTTQEIVLGTGKMGRVYAFNRETGTLLWETAVGDHMNDTVKAFPLEGTTTILPGILGGVETPIAYADGVAYVGANNLATDMINGLTFTLHPLNSGTGDLVAIDVNTGRVLWDKRLGSGLYGGATVVNDLVFTGTYDGMIYAFRRDTGEQVWSYKAPAAVNAWPAVSGDTIVWPVAGPGGEPSIIGFKLGSTSPGVTIVKPDNGSSASVGDLTVSVAVSNFNLVDKLGKANVLGEGHLHYYLDVEAPTAAGKPAIPPSGSTWAATAGTTHTFNNVSSGTHTISVELVNNDHTPLSPPVVTTITVTTDTKPRITISSPSNGKIVRTGNITIYTGVENFNLVDKLGKANVPGEGHIHYFMDTPPVTTPGKPAIPPAGSVWAPSADSSHTFVNVPVGIHHFYVELVNNDHTPLDPPVTKEIQAFVITYTGGLGGQ